MAYSELIKNFERIRDYMRQFYVYGFKSRTEYDKKSARSYDNERRRLESWLGDFMRFRQKQDGKNVFLSVDSRLIPRNPLYNAFKAKSFTAGDVTFHFYILDLLADGKAYTAQEITEAFSEKYLAGFESEWQPDLSTIRKKLKEYVALGILKDEKQGSKLLYSRNEDSVELQKWSEAIAYFSEADPLGVIGSTLMDKLETPPDHYRFKHHYMIHAMDSEIILQIVKAIGERRRIKITNFSVKSDKPIEHTVYPLKIFVSTQGGRQYMLCYNFRFKHLMFFRTDYIKSVTMDEVETEYEKYEGYFKKFRKNLWGTSIGVGFTVEHLEMTLHFESDERFVVDRLEREKRNGRVELVDENTCKFITDVYDANELMPWLRTFIGRIVKLECSNKSVEELFYKDFDALCNMYGGEE